ncbi:MAG: hypothetical protein ACK4YP_15650 [Myxococcota bacterium]
MIAPPSDLPLADLLGEWHIVATTLPFWRGKRRPVVTYAPRPHAPHTWRDTLAWEQTDLFGRPVTRRLGGVDTGDPAVPGRFVWRGDGVLGLLASEWCFVAVDPAGAWAVTWFARATFGVTPEGMDVYARDPDLDPAVVDDVIAGLQARPAFARLGGWFRPER